MPRIKPIVTYSLAAVIIIWVMLGAITLPNATRWFRGSGCSIRQDVVSFPLNKSSTVQDAIPVKYAQKEFKEDIFLIDNTPEVSQQGLQRRSVCSAFAKYVYLHHPEQHVKNCIDRTKHKLLFS
ncbi:hypothetical protein PS6_007282 [Mucor atramentarius]